jgi:hypothetical protein
MSSDIFKCRNLIRKDHIIRKKGVPKEKEGMEIRHCD